MRKTINREEMEKQISIWSNAPGEEPIIIAMTLPDRQYIGRVKKVKEEWPEGFYTPVEVPLSDEQQMENMRLLRSAGVLQACWPLHGIMVEFTRSGEDWVVERFIKCDRCGVFVPEEGTKLGICAACRP